MATLVLGAVGLAAGMSVSGGVGLLMGAGASYLGSRAGGAVDAKIFGTRSITRDGPRLGDLSVQSSAYGEVVPLHYGTVRVSGNIIWSKGLTEIRQEDTQKTSGGKGGGGSSKVTTVTYRYTSSFAVAISGRPIAGVRRIWADGKLLRDAQGRLAVGGAVRLYLGSETQTVDSLIEALEGVGQAPAYRGLAYMVFENLELGEYVNRIPNLTFEVIADEGGTAALADVVDDLASRAGLEVDISGLDAELDGFTIARTARYRDAIETLARVYHFDAIERDGRLVFTHLLRNAIAEIPYDRLLRLSEQIEPVQIVRAQELELPREVSVRYLDPARDYQVGVQRARRQWTPSVTAIDYDLPLVLSADLAKRAAEIELARQWRMRESVQFSVGPEYAWLMPGDVVRITGQDAPFDVMIEETERGGSIVTCMASSYAADIYLSSASGDGGAVPPQVVHDPADTVGMLLNLPALRPVDTLEPIFYAVASSPEPHWRGALLYRSIDVGESFEAISALPSPAVMGVARTQLGAGPADYWDEANMVTVKLISPEMTLEGRTKLAVLNGANAALLGSEIIQFREAILNLEGDYVLKGLLRGRRGTEHHIGGHGEDEPFILLDAARTVAIAGTIGRQDLYKIVTAGAVLSAAEDFGFAVSGENLKPFSPVHLGARREPNGDMTITWMRRTRGDGAWIDGVDVPLAEGQERYDIEICDGVNVVRTKTVGEAMVSYSLAEQIADWGAAQSVIQIRVYQLSDRVGRGVPAEAFL